MTAALGEGEFIGKKVLDSMSKMFGISFRTWTDLARSNREILKCNFLHVPTPVFVPFLLALCRLALRKRSLPANERQLQPPKH